MALPARFCNRFGRPGGQRPCRIPFSPRRRVLKKIKFRPRLVVLASESDRIVLFIHRELALSMLADRRARVAAKDKRKHVTTLRLVAGARDVASLRLRPGSYGISRLRIAPAGPGKPSGVVFSHRNTHETELLAA
jgi:hypothetical protein